jgi:NADH dehydrogenase FAD-containing subunit
MSQHTLKHWAHKRAAGAFKMFIFTLLSNIIQRALLVIFRTSSRSLQSTPRATAMKHIVVLGGSYAGITTAHRILKHVDRLGSFKVTVVAPNSEFYWNMASPRAIIPGQFSDDQLFEPIAAGFAQYPADQFEFVLASAEKLNVEAQKVMITGADGERTLDYDYLIVATGSRTRTNSPFKTLDSTEETKKVLHSYQESVQKAKTIVVAGAGVTGVEIAGELGAQYGHQKDIILVNLCHLVVL